MVDHDHAPDCDCGANGTSRRGFMAGCGAALALTIAGGELETATAAQGGPRPIGPLLDDMPDNWGRFGDDDELGAINYLGGREIAAGMTAVTDYNSESAARFTLQDPITGNAIDALVSDVENPTTDTGDPMFPGRFPARRTNWADASDETGSLATAPADGGMAFADDAFATPLYIQGATHADALGHGWYDGQLYNGFDAATTHTPREFQEGVRGINNLNAVPGDPELGSVEMTHGLGRGDISQAADAGVVGRGVLLDVGRHMGTEGPNGTWLPLDTTGENEDAAITLADLQETADAQGTEIRERDIVLIRTGAIERTKDTDAEWHALGEPGLTYSDALIEWAHNMQIPYMGADNLAVEQITQQVTTDDVADNRADLTGTYLLPLHGAFLRDLGLTLNEVMDLSGLAEQCAEDGIYEFMFSGAPLHVEMATGGPINPVVVKATAEDMTDSETSDDPEPTETETETETEVDTDNQTDTDASGETDTDTEATAASGDGFGIAAAAAGFAGLAGAAARALRDGPAE
ncbi:cyclase family protein [Haloglomus irregulare]|uniref:Cyclase family protein n=2 Tax=Haloglomus irregulare TaxID=2234134 RepID=A0A554MVH6_9EURY|nr:cyclase family protein [Haloglomus irregulare]